MRNLVSFHKEDGSGYKYVASRVLEVDKMNPQLASRIAKSFSVVTKLTGVRKDNLINELKVLLDQKLSKDTFEVVNMSYQAALN
jgi:aminopeptidase N